MGLDGGTYITRSDVLRGQSWALSQSDTSRSTRGGVVSSSTVLLPKRLDVSTERAVKWSTCTLTGQPLKRPVAADYLGSLYNREAVIEFLLARTGVFVDDRAQHRYLNQQRASGFAFDHLQSTKDIFTGYPADDRQHMQFVREDVCQH
ncbi:hypothetical protein WJX72_002239 [[Myrmecia] bisecta]|uniref:DEP domain-containing protein n=1 Tax=[Myrmecia] bisecta TaxID=41462 RepID=A0AAW1PZX0_9CHLO